MFKHILIPTDLSDRAEPAIAMARTLLATGGTKVTLLHVIETLPAATFDELQDFYLELERRSAARLADLCTNLTAVGINATRAIVYGKPAVEITRFAQDHDVDLIALASHPLDPTESPRTWGTLSYRVGMLARCPVLLVK